MQCFKNIKIVCIISLRNTQNIKILDLNTDIPDTRERFEKELLSFISSCSKLTDIKVNAFITTKFLENLLQLKEDGKCTYKYLKVSKKLNLKIYIKLLFLAFTTNIV